MIGTVFPYTLKIIKINIYLCSLQSYNLYFINNRIIEKNDEKEECQFQLLKIKGTTLL